MRWSTASPTSGPTTRRWASPWSTCRSAAATRSTGCSLSARSALEPRDRLRGWEPVRRERLLRQGPVAAAVGDLKVWGGYWDFLRDGRWSPRRQLILGQLAGGEPFRIHRDDRLASAWQGGEIYADDYARALSGSRIGLGFLRQVCPDRHTTRTFEIPACGTLLLADRTDEHLGFFEEGQEAEFFGSAGGANRRGEVLRRPRARARLHRAPAARAVSRPAAIRTWNACAL